MHFQMKRIVWTAKTKIFENAGLICILFTFYKMLHQSKTCHMDGRKRYENASVDVKIGRGLSPPV